jgi:two-component system alkaline phosphatase synthesis response regulator PhoP
MDDELNKVGVVGGTSDLPEAGASDRAEPVVLLIDDDDSVRSFVRTRLEGDGFRVIEATSGEDGLAMLTPEVTIVIVDVGLPGIDGFGVVRAIRRTSDVPIVMMTAASAEGDRVLGLELGADDYIVKPFLPREMAARVRAAVRRGAPLRAVRRHDDDAPKSEPEQGALAIDAGAREAFVDGVLLTLTSREFDLLAFLAASPRQVFSRVQLLRSVWGSEPEWVGDATVTELVHRVRKELQRHPASSARIVTVRGAGYRFDP